jgi:putative phage-type endonuclease
MAKIKERLAMPPEIIKCEQRSDDWIIARLGKITSTHFSDVLNKKTGRKTYMMRVLAEILTGEPQPGFKNAAMEWGIETEPRACDWYSTTMDTPITQVGFVHRGHLAGCSPDGYVGDEGMVEIKCPHPSTHAEYILANKLPSQYKPQVQGQLWITGRDWCDFVSFDPRTIDNPFWWIRVHPDDEYINELKEATALFIEELAEKVKAVGRPAEVKKAIMTSALPSPWGRGDEALAWAEAHKEEVKGKIRHGLSWAYMSGTPADTLPANPTDPLKRTINLWVDYIVTGE